jgi:hypothetical protein
LEKLLLLLDSCAHMHDAFQTCWVLGKGNNNSKAMRNLKPRLTALEACHRLALSEG